MLKNQVKIYCVGANSFLNKEENEIIKKKKGLELYVFQLKEFTLVKLIQDINNQKIIFDNEDKVYRYNKESDKNELVEDIELTKFLLKFKKHNTIEKVYKRNPRGKFKRNQIKEVNDGYVVEIFQKCKYEFTDIYDYIQQIETSPNKKYIRRDYVNRVRKNNEKLMKDKAFKDLMKEIDNNYIKYEKVEYTTPKGKKRTKKVDKGYRGEIKELDKKFKALIKNNTEQRTLNKVNKYSIIGVFESDLTRILGIKTNELNEDLITVEISYYPIMKQLLDKGFTYKNENYVYFSSSANQIKSKKMVFIKESIWKQFEMRIMCGLTIDDINESAQQGCNINKFLAYTSLISSASDRWENVLSKKFNIDECIVIPDFETTLKDREVDYIAKTRATREIYKKDSKGKNIKGDDGKWETETEEYWLLADEAERVPKDITIEHSDGAGWILPSLSKKNFQFRLNWMKGLLTPVDFLKWTDIYNEGNCKVKDIWGKEWDLKQDNIKIVFSKSQFKMWKYYKDWDDYKTKFKEYDCQANICNMEDNEFKYSNFNYQMWQTLEECDSKVIDRFTDKIDKLVNKAYTDKKTMLDLLGATKRNKSTNYLQEALMIYPELLQDKHIQEQLSDCISKIRKESAYGKFQLDKAHYTYLIPDVFAWMQYVFKGEEEPQGLLEDGEAYCNLFNTEKYPRLLVNRSPHLYKEHCVRNNVTNEQMEKWYITDGIYTSSSDLISRELNFDNDGDQSLCIGDSDIIEQAEENMKGIVPLYYEMGKAPAKIINSENIYNSLVSAFSYGNIGEYSNRLSKLWNQDTSKMTDEQKEQKLNLGKIICCQNNFSIDASKTLEMVEVSDKIKKQIAEVEKYKLPYFFRYNKDKDITEVEEMNNSTVNTICKKIENIKQGRFDWNCVGKLNWHKLMNDWKVDITTDTAKKVIEKYKELNEDMQNYFRYISNSSMVDEETSKERIADLVYSSLREDFESFCERNELNIIDCTDIIIKHIYKTNRNCKKSLLFNVLGDIIVQNLTLNIIPEVTKKKKSKKPKCLKCGKEFKKEHNRQKYCSDECKKEARKVQDRERKRAVKQ